MVKEIIHWSSQGVIDASQRLAQVKENGVVNDRKRYKTAKNGAITGRNPLYQITATV